MASNDARLSGKKNPTTISQMTVHLVLLWVFCVHFQALRCVCSP